VQKDTIANAAWRIVVKEGEQAVHVAVLKELKHLNRFKPP
jgi:hypothetical protein